MTLLSICEEAASELGLRQPESVVGSTDLTAQILYRLANQSGKHLMRYHSWQALVVEKSFTSLATQEQTNALPPADYDRMAYNVEIWNATSNQRFVGPTPQRYWRQLQVGLLTAGAPGYWRILGNQLNILPIMTAGQTLEFEYISKRWCESAAGDPQSSFMADTDVALIDEELFVLEMVWRFRKSRGFAQYAEDMMTAEIEKEKVASRDRGTGRIRGTGRSDGPPPPTWSGTIDG
jgi:hypothetical protein